MNRSFRIGVALASALCIAGCVMPGPPTVPTAVVSPEEARVVPARSARDAVVIGKSTRADVRTALGETLIVSFESGYEVWVYRLANDKAGRSTRDAMDEFVVLFAPSGLVAKTRIRPAPLT